MEYLKAIFKFSCDAELLQVARDLMADAVAEAGFESFEDTDDGLTGYVQKELLDRQALQQAVDDFPLEGVKTEYIIEEAEQQDWNAEWEEAGFDPIIVRGKIVIYDARHTTLQQMAELSKQYPESTDIAIEARMAFGTGTHQTTQMIVSALLDTNFEGKRMLDCGCGTGILGITATKLGAEDAVGYDIDEWSVENAQHNCQLNGVTNMRVYHGDSNVLGHISGLFDVVVANINRNILLADMHAFKDVMMAGGTLILSGFYEDDIPTLLEEASRYDLTEQRRMVSDNWACLVLE